MTIIWSPGDHWYQEYLIVSTLISYRYHIAVIRLNQPVLSHYNICMVPSSTRPTGSCFQEFLGVAEGGRSVAHLPGPVQLSTGRGSLRLTYCATAPGHICLKEHQPTTLHAGGDIGCNYGTNDSCCFLLVYIITSKIYFNWFNVRGSSYLGLTRSLSLLLMSWLLASSGHQHPRYWPCRICRSLPYLRKDFNYLCHVDVEEWHKRQIYVCSLWKIQHVNGWKIIGNKKLLLL